jgi:hypothetical protein
MKLAKIAFASLALVAASQTFAAKETKTPPPVLETTTTDVAINPASVVPVIVTAENEVTPENTPSATPDLTTTTTEAVVDVAAPAK